MTTQQERGTTVRIWAAWVVSLCESNCKKSQEVLSQLRSHAGGSKARLTSQSFQAQAAGSRGSSLVIARECSIYAIDL